jgi:hypothetical protein
MPHVICAGHADLVAAWHDLPRGPWHWGNAVARVEACFLGRDEASLLVAGVVVEYGRPLHAVVLVSNGREETAFHLWRSAPVERTDAVKRLLAQVAREMAAFGAGAVITTNIPKLL